jgi:hypothetical protein
MVKVILKTGREVSKLDAPIELDEDGRWSHDEIMSWLDTLPYTDSIMDDGYTISVHEIEYHWTEVVVTWKRGRTNCRAEFHMI